MKSMSSSLALTVKHARLETLALERRATAAPRRDALAESAVGTKVRAAMVGGWGVCGSDRRSANNRHASRTARRSLTASSSGEVLKCLWADFLVFLDLQLLLVGQLFLTSKHTFGHRDVIKVVTTSLQKIRRNSSYGNASASSSKSPPGNNPGANACNSCRFASALSFKFCTCRASW